jgi:dipeptide transport system substrate-binding protein
MRAVIRWAAAALLVGFASGASAKTLVYCSDAAPEGFDPARYVTRATLDASAQLFYDRLVEFAPGSTAVTPALAESWDVSADGRTYTFHLRQNVHFQSTDTFTPKRDFSADDVVFSLTRQSDRKNPWFAYAGGNWPWFDGLGFDTLIRSVDKVDAATVRITLTRADSGFLSDLAMDFASIVSKDYADTLLKGKQQALLDSAPVGTGPFIYNHVDDSHVYAVANKDYWRGAPKLDTIIFSVTPAAADRLAKLKSGACQVAPIDDAADLRAAKAEASLAVTTAPAADVVYLAFNASKPPFNDVRVRKAVSEAIDRDAIARTVYLGLAEPATRLVPSTMAGADATVPADTFDPAAAKQALHDAGVGSLSVKLLATATPRPYSPDLVGTANLIASDLTAAGVNASVETATLSDYLRRSAEKSRDEGVVIGWTSAAGDLGNFLSVLLSCEAVGKSNRAEWCDQAFNARLVTARTADPAAAATALNEAQHIAAEQAPLVPLVHTLQAVVTAKSVSGCAVDPLGRHNFAAVDLAN